MTASDRAILSAMWHALGGLRYTRFRFPPGPAPYAPSVCANSVAVRLCSLCDTHGSSTPSPVLFLLARRASSRSSSSRLAFSSLHFRFRSGRLTAKVLIAFAGCMRLQTANAKSYEGARVCRMGHLELTLNPSQNLRNISPTITLVNGIFARFSG